MRIMVMRIMLAALLLAPMLQAKQAPADRADAGKSVWQGQMCRNCHGDQGEGGYGPDLAGRGLSLAQFKRAVRQPWSLMPAFTEQQVPDQAISDLHAFLSNLPKVEQPGEWHWRHTPPGAHEGQRLQSTFGCGQCHEPEMRYPRRWLGGVAKDADYAYFARQVYQHTEKYPKGRMGTFSKERLPESILREIFRFVQDAGLLVPVTASLAAGTPQGANTVYTLTVSNEGVAGKGLTAEDVTIFVRVPSGCTLVTGTGAGYQGVRALAGLGLTPALPLAPHPHMPSDLPERPSPDLKGDVAVWKVPHIAPGEKQTYTLTLSGPGPAAEVLQGFAGSTVYWERPSVRMRPPNLLYRDLRLPDKGDQYFVRIPGNRSS